MGGEGAPFRTQDLCSFVFTLFPVPRLPFTVAYEELAIAVGVQLIVTSTPCCYDYVMGGNGVSSVLRTLVFIWTRRRHGCEEEERGPGRTLGFLLPLLCAVGADLWGCIAGMPVLQLGSVKRSPNGRPEEGH